MKHSPNLPPPRPEILDIQILQDDANKTVLYQEVGGESPEITNHFSLLNFEVVRGVGVLAVDGMVAHLHAGSRVEVLPGNPYAYKGTMDMVITSQPPMNPDFITYGSQKLGAEQKRFLRRRKKWAQSETFMNEVVEKFIPYIEATSRYIQKPEHQNPK